VPIARRADGTVVRSVADISSGDELVTVVGDGRITSTVSTTEQSPEQIELERRN